MGLFEERVSHCRGAFFTHTGKEIGRARIEVDLKRIPDDNKCEANDRDHLLCLDRAEYNIVYLVLFEDAHMDAQDRNTQDDLP